MDTLNILLVDDDRNLVTTLSYGLRKATGAGISVVLCFNSSEALSLLATRTIDVVVSNFDMPGPSGLELLRRIRNDHPETTLVLSTAYGTDQLEEEMRQLGGGYITKPFEPSLLVQTIKGLLQGKETTGRSESGSPVMDKPGNSERSSGSIRLERIDLASS